MSKLRGLIASLQVLFILYVPVMHSEALTSFPFGLVESNWSTISNDALYFLLKFGVGKEE